jgi:DNA-binding transcriptional LysR family regulator
MLRAFREARPRVHVDLRQIGWQDYSGGLEDGTVDAAFVWLPFEHPDLSFAALHEEPRVAALHEGHALTGKRELRVEQIVYEPWPWVDSPSAVRDFWTCAEYRGGEPARRGPTVVSMEGVLDGVRAGLCVATVPRSQAEVSAWPGIVFRPVRDLTPATLALGWRSADETPVVQALVEIARQVAAGGPLPHSSDAPD